MTRPDALFARLRPEAALVQLVRFKRAEVAAAAASVLVDALSNSDAEGADIRDTGFRVVVNARSGAPLDQCEVFPADGAAILMGFDRCMRAAWQRGLGLAVSDDSGHLESWDPRGPLGANPAELRPAWARDVLARGGFSVTRSPEAVEIHLESTLPASAFDVALSAPAATVKGLREGGWSLARVKESVRSARDEAKKGVRQTLSLRLDQTALAWSLARRPASEALAEAEPGERQEGRLSRSEITLLSFELCGELRAFGWSGYRPIPLPKGPLEHRAVKHLLLAHAAGLPF